MLLTAARQEHQKGLDVLLTAFARVRREVPDAVLLLAGPEGSRTGALRELAARVGGTGDSASAAEAVRFMGHRETCPI